MSVGCACEPKIGDVIIKRKYYKYQYLPCSKCDKPRWIQIVNGVPKHLMCLSCTIKTQNETYPEIKQKRINGLHIESSNEKRRQGVIRSYQNPELHEKHRQAMIKRYSNPEEIERTRQSTLDRYKDPNERLKTSELNKIRWAKRPEAKERKRQEMIKKWSDPEYKERVIRNTFIGMQIKPNIPEQIMKDILDKYFPNEWVYNGDGKVIIGGKCPDFIHNNGQHLIIEVFGDYFHDPTRNKMLKSHQTEKGTYKVFANAGYRTLIIWECDVEKLSCNELANRVRAFMDKKEGVSF